ncbi:unnamed protein product [Closterium sp. Yama58-4]|nr:unnamed protein product [Closterium sp. Yama58-4]
MWLESTTTDESSRTEEEIVAAANTEMRGRAERRRYWMQKIETMSEREFIGLFRINRAILEHIEKGLVDEFRPITATNVTVCHRVVDVFLQEFPKKFKADWVRFPTRERMQEMEAEFRECKGVPNVIGAVDGTHLQVRGIDDYRSEYYCRKQTARFSRRVLYMGSYKWERYNHTKF